MELVIQKWGNGAAVRLPAQLLGLLNVRLGDKLCVIPQPEGVFLKAARPVYSLAELVAQCDPSAPAPVDMEGWCNMKPLGNEVC